MLQALLLIGLLLLLNGGVAFWLWRRRPGKVRFIGRTQWLSEIAHAEDPPEDGVLRIHFAGEKTKKALK